MKIFRQKQVKRSCEKVTEEWTKKRKWYDSLKTKFSSRSVKPKEIWTKQCGCGSYMPNEYDICNRCLVLKFADGINSNMIGEGWTSEEGYTSENVAYILRRVRGEVVVKIR